MRTIIAGSRTILDYSHVEQAVEKSGFHISQVVSGHALGVDKLGELWASMRQIPISIYPADWDRYGKGAGYQRNVQMAQNADALIAVYDGKSRGTQHMIDIAIAKGLKVFVYKVQDGSYEWHTS